MNKVLKLGIILFLVCAIVAGVLGVVNELTYQRIADYTREKTEQAFATVLPADGYKTVDFDRSAPAFKTVDTISEASGDAGWVVQTTFSGAQGSITMVVGVDKEYKCTGISVISHSETSGLGANAASPAEAGQRFRASFIGQGEEINVKSIDALSGATITSRSCANATAACIAAVKALG